MRFSRSSFNTKFSRIWQTYGKFVSWHRISNSAYTNWDLSLSAHSCQQRFTLTKDGMLRWGNEGQACLTYWSQTGGLNDATIWCRRDTAPRNPPGDGEVLGPVNNTAFSIQLIRGFLPQSSLMMKQDRQAWGQESIQQIGTQESLPKIDVRFSILRFCSRTKLCPLSHRKYIGLLWISMRDLAEYRKCVSHVHWLLKAAAHIYSRSTVWLV